uniref:RING-type domain-containing protein n=1 Tax=viral metagenome TaxID=1070528 RepID=A0A6C0HER9_9ZZZZ
MYELPLLFALRRYRPGVEIDHPELEKYKDSCILIQTSKSVYNTWSFTILNNVASILKRAKITPYSEDRWLDNDIVQFKIQVDDERIISNIKFNNYCIKFDVDGFMIPLFKISEPHKILGDIYCDLHHDDYTSYRFNLFPSINKSVIPVHIMKVYIQSLIDKGETCPISLESFEIDKTCITSCGHALSKSSAETWFLKNTSCPVCRASCELLV